MVGFLKEVSVKGRPYSVNVRGRGKHSRDFGSKGTEAIYWGRLMQ